jgi:hypothetical protein
MVSLETLQPVRTFQTGRYVQAVHPANKFLLTRPMQDKMGVFNTETGRMEKILFCGKRKDWSPLAALVEGELKQAGVGENELKEWRGAFTRGSESILNLKFSSDARLRFCALEGGLRVLAWDAVIHATDTTPEPLFSVTPRPDAVPFVLDHRNCLNPNCTAIGIHEEQIIRD